MSLEGDLRDIVPVQSDVLNPAHRIGVNTSRYQSEWNRGGGSGGFAYVNQVKVSGPCHNLSKLSSTIYLMGGHESPFV